MTHINRLKAYKYLYIWKKNVEITELLRTKSKLNDCENITFILKTVQPTRFSIETNIFEFIHFRVVHSMRTVKLLT